MGNVYDKYGTRNPIARWLHRRFLRAVTGLYQQARPQRVLEVGCGEGRLAQHLLKSGARPQRFVACDLTVEHVCADADPFIQFHEGSIYNLPFADDEFDLVVCCEVLEHLDDPQRGLDELVRVSGRAVLISTPREPLWRALNLLRGAYVRHWGNTPGHVQHFSRRGLIQLAKSRFSVRAIRSPLPWTVLLGEVC